MSPMMTQVRAHSKRMTLGIMCGMVLALAGAAQAQERPVGVEVGMNLPQYAGFLAANVTHQRNVNFLHLSQVIVGNGNTAVITAGVNQNNNKQPADTVYFPAPGATAATDAVPSAFKQINSNDQFIGQTIVGNGNTAVVQADVNQSNTGTYTPGKTRWLWMPASRVGELQAVNSQININNSHVEQVAIGDGNNLVAVLGVNQNNLSIPGDPTQKGTLANIAVNVNTNVVAQTVVGNGNTAVAQINVNQQNM